MQCLLNENDDPMCFIPVCSVGILLYLHYSKDCLSQQARFFCCLRYLWVFFLLEKKTISFEGLKCISKYISMSV